MTTSRRTIYGRYSLGSGAVMRDPERLWAPLADPEVLASYRASIAGDLARAGIDASDLAGWHVMDVGTGRQALALLELGARRVSHFDLAPENVAAVEQHIATMDQPARLSTACCDLVTADLGSQVFDFIYLNGIAQHFSDVGRGIANCVRALKPGGLMWLYFYRSGSFDQFVVYFLRWMTSGGNEIRDPTPVPDYHAAARLFFSGDARRSYLSSAFMDGLFTRYARCYSVTAYLDFAEACGLELVASSGIEPVDRHIDHVHARGAGVVTLRKSRRVDDAALDRAAALLSPEREVDQLDPGLYHEAGILRTIELARALKQALASPPVPSALVALAALRIFSFYMEITKAPGYDPVRRHRDLQDLLGSILTMLDDEYGTRGRTA